MCFPRSSGRGREDVPFGTRVGGVERGDAGHVGRETGVAGDGRSEGGGKGGVMSGGVFPLILSSVASMCLRSTRIHDLSPSYRLWWVE